MTRWHRFTPILLSALLLPLLAVPAAQEKEQPVVRARIGTWNIEWLGNPTKRKKPVQKAEDIAAYIAASKVELLGLNEISTDGATDGQPTSSILAEACKLLKSKERGDWQHVLFPSEDKDHKDQLCGVAWNAARWKMIDKPYRVPLRRTPQTSEDVWRRHPYAVKFSHGEKQTDIVVIPVHMKSNFGGVTQRSKTRSEEALLLVRSLAAVQNQFKDDDAVIVGDFNCLLREEPALQRYRSAGLRDLNFADQLTWIKDRLYDAAPFDRILVPEDQPEFKDAPLTVFRDHSLNSEREYRERLSDHYLVYTDIRIMEDDD